MPRLNVYREPKPAHTHSSSRNSMQSHSPNSPRDHRQYHDGHRHNHRPHRHHRDEPKRKLSTLQAHMVAFSGEFVGTFMFLFFSFSAQIMLATQRSESSTVNGMKSAQENIFTALVYGMSLLVNVWAFYRISGGLFNPAVTLGLVLGGALPAIRGIILLPAQILAGMAAGGLVSVLFPGDIALTNTTLSPGTSITQGVFIEMFMTAELVFVVLMLAVEKSKDTFLAPIGVGLALFVAMMGGVYFTGGSLNPARSFGPAVVSTQFPGYHWLYWVGPFLGGALAAGYYRFVKHFNYEQANPGQDSADGDFTD